jgi:outer membrane protein assembly factor BamE (lipoprotein component of BamABCDE complex)
MKLGLYTLLALFALSACSSSTNNYSKQVTAAHILEVELGMTKSEVIEILGQPVHKTFETFQYTHERIINYPMLWIHFDSTGVISVYSEYEEWLDEPGIYGLSQEDGSPEPFQWGEDALRQYFK